MIIKTAILFFRFFDFVCDIFEQVKKTLKRRVVKNNSPINISESYIAYQVEAIEKSA